MADTSKIIAALHEKYPDPRIALRFSNPLELLVATMLSAQCTDKRVNEVTPGLFRKYPTVKDFANASQDELANDIRSTGFYRNKARAVIGCCRALVERFGGKVPETLADLLTLPGVGRKTANIVLGNVFGQPTIGVDTHVMRLSQRLGFTTNTDPDKIEFDLIAFVPAKQRVRFCHLLQYHGRRVCIAKKPACPQCAISALCPYPDKTRS